MTPRMRVVYLAGPFRGKDHFEIHQNICRAEELSLQIWRAGAACLCPHLNTAHFQGAGPDDIWLNGDIEMLRRCDGVLMTPDWRRSMGATAEHEFAAQHRIPVFYSIEEVVEWLAEHRPPVANGWGGA